MNKAIDDLEHEHEAILFSLRILGKMESLVKERKALDTVDAMALIDFLKEFVDKCHHGKEERILFPAFEKAGIPNEGGPIGVMLNEHELGREYIRGMTKALEGPVNLESFTHNADGYCSLLTRHIDKENTILFPMGERALDSDLLDAIYERFEEHEEKVIGAGRHEQLHAMLNEFEKKYL